LEGWILRLTAEYYEPKPLPIDPEDPLGGKVVEPKAGWYVLPLKALFRGYVTLGDTLKGPFAEKDWALIDYREFDRESREHLTTAFLPHDLDKYR